MCAEGEKHIEYLKSQITEARKKRASSQARLRSAKDLSANFHKLFVQAQRQIVEKRIRNAQQAHRELHYLCGHCSRC
jgi:hypothetical protein